MTGWEKPVQYDEPNRKGFDVIEHVRHWEAYGTQLEQERDALAERVKRLREKVKELNGHVHAERCYGHSLETCNAEELAEDDKAANR